VEGKQVRDQRLRPLPPEQWDDDAVAALRGAFPEGVVDRFLSSGADTPAVPNVLATLMHHPRLAAPFFVYNGVLLWHPALELRARELVVLRVSWRTRSRYQWVHHVQFASPHGITAEDIDAITRGIHSDAWTPLEHALIQATDQLIDRYRIDDDTWARLAEELDERQLIELLFVVGTYTCLAMAFNSFGLQLEPGIDMRGMHVPPD
jgi:4-carboxymuconolactone decarboxylase